MLFKFFKKKTKKKIGNGVDPPPPLGKSCYLLLFFWGTIWDTCFVEKIWYLSPRDRFSFIVPTACEISRNVVKTRGPEACYQPVPSVMIFPELDIEQFHCQPCSSYIQSSVMCHESGISLIIRHFIFIIICCMFSLQFLINADVSLGKG